MGQWLAGAQKIDMSGSRGNGPFGNFLGVILHVNVSGKSSQGTSIDYFKNNPYDVMPNFQVYKDGSIVQFLPMNWQPWCQIAGNYNYAAIETGGDPDEPLTDAQVKSCAKIIAAYKDQMGMAMQVANAPGQRGLGTHEMGGSAWGGHACPGTLRANQRNTILALAQGKSVEGEDDMPLTNAEIEKIAKRAADYVWAHEYNVPGRVTRRADYMLGHGWDAAMWSNYRASQMQPALDGVTKALTAAGSGLLDRVANVQKAVDAVASAVAGVSKAVDAVKTVAPVVDVTTLASKVSETVSAKVAALTWKAN